MWNHNVQKDRIQPFQNTVPDPTQSNGLDTGPYPCLNFDYICRGPPTNKKKNNESFTYGLLGINIG